MNKKVRNQEFEGAPADAWIGLLDAYVRLLTATGAESSSVECLRSLVSNLRRMPEAERAALIRRRGGPEFGAKKTAPILPDDRVAVLSLSEVEAILRADSTTRLQLHRVASLRFGMSKGALAPLPKEALVEKIRTLVEHEGTHESITRAASSAPQSEPEAKKEKVPDHPASTVAPVDATENTDLFTDQANPRAKR